MVVESSARLDESADAPAEFRLTSFTGTAALAAEERANAKAAPSAVTVEPRRPILIPAQTRTRPDACLSTLDERGLVLAPLKGSPGDELDPRLNDERTPKPLADRLGQLVLRGDVLSQLDCDREGRLLLHARRPGPHEDVAADLRRERAHDLTHRRREHVDPANNEHVVGAADAAHARARPPARTLADAQLDVVARPETEEGRGAVLQMAEDELAARAVRDLARLAALGIDHLGVDEPARAEVHAVLLLALAPEGRADVADAHRFRDRRAPALFELGPEGRLAASGL